MSLETPRQAEDDGGDEPLLAVEGLTKHFSEQDGLLGGLGFEWDGGLPRPTWGGGDVQAVDDVSFTIREGETLGLVGESGCGKSTLARTVLRLLEPTDGRVYFKGEDIATMGGERLRTRRKDMQMIFQDPQSSLNPRMKVGPIVEEPMRAHDMPKSDPDVETTAAVTDETPYDVEVTVDDDVDVAVPAEDGVATASVTVREADDGAGVEATVDSDLLGATASVDDAAGTASVRVSVTASKADLRRAQARDLLGKVGLDPQHYNRYPHQFSGGQRQRINLARALSVNPDFIVCDEPTSALDASIQAQVLNTMNDLQEEFGLTYLFISHDLSVVRHISDRVAVMYLGHIVEVGDKEELFENPQHPYTESLLSSIPVPDPRKNGGRAALQGDVPSPIDPPSGCRFRTRCPELIAPEKFGLTDGEWDAVRSFVRAVDRRTFEAPDPGTVRAEFFGDDPPDGEAGDVVEEAVHRVVADEWDEAATDLRAAFEEASICAQERPDYTVEDDSAAGEHFAACHLHRDASQTH
jgi:oligopeptide/dipeptide ABC transporter ATP-binding protein